MRRVELRIDGFLWDDFNEAKLRAHEIATRTIDEVLQNAPEFFINFPGRSAEYLMIGPDLQGRFYYAPFVPTNDEGIWYVVTAHRIDERRARRYYGASGGQG